MNLRTRVGSQAQRTTQMGCARCPRDRLDAESRIDPMRKQKSSARAKECACVHAENMSLATGQEVDVCWTSSLCGRARPVTMVMLRFA